MTRSAAQREASRRFYAEYAPDSQVYADQGVVDTALAGAVYWCGRLGVAIRYERTVRDEDGQERLVGRVVWCRGPQQTGHVSLPVERLRRVR